MKKKKVKKESVKKLISKPIKKLVSKPSWRPLRTKDYTLTKFEEELVKKSKLESCCNCCQHYAIGQIINRIFYACGRCYCCAGDNPNYDLPNLCIKVNDSNGCMAFSWK